MTRWAVVGAGAAGCVVAARLAEAGHDVTLIEAGAGVAAVDATADPDRMFESQFPRGRGIGGSSAVNGMIATPGDAAQYEQWGWHDAGQALARVRVPLEVARVDELSALDHALLAAAPDAVRATLTRRHGRRVTAAEAYLDGSDVTVVADAEAVRVDLAGRRAVGVGLADGRCVAAEAVVVCAGAIGSPLLLRASGVDVPGIGQGLQNHPGLPVTVRLRHGADGARPLVAGTLLRRDDIQLVPLHLGGPEEAVVLVMLMSPTGTGDVHDSAVGAVVDHVLSDHDHRRLDAGLDLAREVLAHPAMRGVVDDIDVGTAPDLVYHPTSTCRIGVVVDDDGAVVDHAGLFVADASVFPGIPHANTYLPTLMLAERLAARITRRRAAPPSTAAGGR